MKTSVLGYFNKVTGIQEERLLTAFSDKCYSLKIVELS